MTSRTRDASFELTVFITTSRQSSTSSECQEELARSSWITLTSERQALCLTCADLDHLVFLPSGDAALTRRARQHSVLSAVVVRWSRARKRYERQGLLVEERALQQAETESECLADADARARRRERDALRRMELDAQHVEAFALQVRSQFPQCPEDTARKIAEHACLTSSGRIGRTAEGKALAEEAVRLAVIAHIRHASTDYDRLLARGHDRRDARALVAADVDRVLATWEGKQQPTTT